MPKSRPAPAAGPERIAERCSGCGREIPGGEAACQQRFEELIARDFSNVLYGRWHRLLVDTYCMQHPERYCVSAKSLVAHLGGLCCGVERAGDAATYRALQQSLNGRVEIEKPELPSDRGPSTVAEVEVAEDPMAYAEAVQCWARSTWEAYSSLHVVAREYLSTAGANAAHHQDPRQRFAGE